MKVILLKDVKGVGRIHEVKDVADGYAINNLLPRKLVELATPEKIERLKASTAQHEKEVAAQEEALAAHIKGLNGAHVGISARATEKGGLFKAIGAPEIIRAIKAEKKLDIPEETVMLEHPLKTTGEHSVELRAHGATSTIVVAIAPQN